MNNRFQFLFTATLGLVTAFTARADGPGSDVVLYLAPDAATPLLMHTSASDPRLASAKPATDTIAAIGWQTTEISGPFTGYVLAGKTKDGAVLPGTAVHSAAKEDSPVLGIAAESPALSVKDTEGDWAEVSYAAPVTVYFQKAGAPAAPEVKAPEAKAPEIKVEEVKAPPTPAPATPAPAIAAPSRPAAVAPVSVVPAATLVSALPAPTKVDAAEVGHYYIGTLKFRSNPITAGPINAEYMLYADNGAFIALVDLSGVILPNPISSYLGKPVKIFGTPYTMSSMPSIVIRAQLLQAN